MREKILSVLVILFGVLAFLILNPQVWWLGLIFAVLGVITGSATLKTLHIRSVIGVVLSIAACVAYLSVMSASGASIFG